MNGFDDLYSGNAPDLISKKVIKDFHLMYNSRKTLNVIPENGVSSFYSEYIQPNLILLILLFIFILFLVCRYTLKDDMIAYEKMFNVGAGNNVLYKANPASVMAFKNDDEKKVYNSSNNNIPTFNPYYPISKQNSLVNYLPDNIPLKIDDKYTIYTDLHPVSRDYKEQLFSYNENNDELEYTGTFNTYQNSVPSCVNQLGYTNDYNITTENAVSYMTALNKKNLESLY